MSKPAVCPAAGRVSAVQPGRVRGKHCSFNAKVAANLPPVSLALELFADALSLTHTHACTHTDSC